MARLVLVDDKKAPYIHQQYPMWVNGGKMLVHSEDEHRQHAPDDFLLKEIVETESAESQLLRLDAFLREHGLSAPERSPVDSAIDLMKMAMEPSKASESAGAEDPPRRGPGRPPKNSLIS